MIPQPINLAAKLDKFSEQWSPKIVAELNDHEVKLVKIEGEFVWHKHDETDESFLVLDGSMTVHFENGDVTLDAGELLVVPRGMTHKTSAQRECKVLIMEKRGTMNTGDANERTAPMDRWI